MTTKESCTIYFNPRCQKCRETLSLLETKKVNTKIIEYLKTPPTAKELKDLVKKLGIPAEALIRKKEALFQELNPDISSEEKIIQLLVKHPALIERPIVVKDGKAVLGRPPEKVLDLL